MFDVLIMIYNYRESQLYTQETFYRLVFIGPSRLIPLFVMCQLIFGDESMWAIEFSDLFLPARNNTLSKLFIIIEKSQHLHFSGDIQSEVLE